MSKISKSKLFSAHFRLKPEDIEAEGLVDPVLNYDTSLFIDPLLLQESANPTIKKEAFPELKRQFGNVVRLIHASKRTDDAAWKGAKKILSLDERPETCLGYGGSGISGSRRPDTIRDQILNTAKEIVSLGEDDPQIISLMGLFERDVGPDTISDMTTTIIRLSLAKITAAFAKKHRVPTTKLADYEDWELPENPYRKGVPILLVPRDIVRDLPLAVDWSDVAKVAFENASLRDTFNRFVGAIAEATITAKKAALKKAALSSIENFRELFEAVLESSDAYDPNADAENYYNFRRLFAQSNDYFQASLAKPQKTRAGLEATVVAIIDHYRRLIEKNNLWEMLWIKDKPKRERAAQLLFFAVAELFCITNNIDISPETNMGGGPVDFKFSSGYTKKLIVEIKLSKGRVEHGYTTQLPRYKEAAGTDLAIFLVINVGKMGSKLAKIEAYRDAKLANKEEADRIEVVDGRRQESASKLATSADDEHDEDVDDEDEEDNDLT